MIILAICWPAVYIIIGLVVYVLVVIGILEIATQWIYRPELWKRIVCIIVRATSTAGFFLGLYLLLAEGINK